MSNVQEQQQPEDPRQESPAAPVQNGTWPTTSRTPSTDPDFLILYHGLFCFARNDNYGATPQNVSETGVHTKAAEHKFGVVVFESRPSATPGGPAVVEPIYGFIPERARDVPGREIIIDVSQPTFPGITYYDGGSGNERNWSLVPDFEGPNFYDRPLVKRPKALGLRVITKHGLFHSLLKPRESGGFPEFDRIIETAQQYKHPIGKVAYYAATELSHNPGGNVSIQFGKGENSTTLMLRATDGRKYTIYFLNICLEDDKPCKHNPTDPIKERRNDYYLYRKVFDLNTNDPEYGLILRTNGLAPEPATARPAGSLRPFTEAIFSQNLLQDKFSNPEAPCGSTSFGQTRGGFGGG